MPSRVGTWPQAMLSAAPVMKAAMATSGISSTMKPARIRPMKSKIAPAMTARPRAICSASNCGYSAWTRMTTLPTMVDMTATV